MLRPPLALPVCLSLVLLLGAARPAEAQFGAIEAFARQVTDLSFYGGIGGLVPGSDELEGEGLFSFGVELLFQVAEKTRPIEGAATPERADSVRLTWTTMEVVHSEGGVDTIYNYEVRELPPPSPPRETLWTVEIGIGYGQMGGFDLTDPGLTMRGSVRDLPAVSLYASYEPIGTYFGLRSGFMRTQGLQVIVEESGESYGGDAEAFLVGALVGYAFEISSFYTFLEASYTSRYFPSVEWSGGTLPAGIPTQLRLGGWNLTTGIQFGIKD